VEAVGTNAKANLEALTVNEAGSLLQTAMAGQSLLSNVDVSVTAVSDLTLDMTTKPYLFTQAFLATDVSQSNDEAGESGWMNPVSMIMVVLATLFCILALSWRFRHALGAKPPARPEPPEPTAVRITIQDQPDVEDSMLSGEMAMEIRKPTRLSTKQSRPSWGNRSRFMTDLDDPEPDAKSFQQSRVANEMSLPPPPDQTLRPELGPFDHADLESREAPQSGSGITMRGCCV